MAYSKTINISPSTITNLTVIVKDAQPSFYAVLTLDDFTLSNDALTGSLRVSTNDTEISIYSQGYTPIITTYGNISTNITLLATNDYSKISDGTNSYYVKDSYSRQFESDLLDITKTKADTTLSNVSSIDNNSAVKSVLNEKVDKSGDTMNGQLDFVFPELDLTTIPTANIYKGITLKDNNDNRIGRLEIAQYTNGDYATILSTKQQGTSGVHNFFILGYDSSNNQSYISAPDLNGAFHAVSLHLAESQSVNGSTDVNYSLTNYLPNDDYYYYVWVSAYGVGDATSGHTNNVAFGSQIFGSSPVCRSINRSAASTLSSGTIIVPVGTDRILRLTRNTTYYGTVSIYLRGYQRIGRNS